MKSMAFLVEKSFARLYQIHSMYTSDVRNQVQFNDFQVGKKQTKSMKVANMISNVFTPLL